MCPAVSVEEDITVISVTEHTLVGSTGFMMQMVDAHSVGNVLAIKLWQLLEGHGCHSIQQLLMNHL